MARPKKQAVPSPNNFVTNQSSFFGSAILALIIIVLGFLAINGLSQTSTKTTAKKTTQQTTQTLNQKQTTKPNTQTKTPTAQNNSNPSFHTVTAGENLWKIAMEAYNDGYKWTAIANENKLTNPDHITVGMVLSLPQISTQPTTQTIPNNQSASSPNNNQKITYTVAQGDCLWTIAEKFYGTGYKWVVLRDANNPKVGLLPNGRPLITPGTILSIPTG